MHKPCRTLVRLSRASTFCSFGKIKDVDGRDIGERSDAVLRTAMPGQDELLSQCKWKMLQSAFGLSRLMQSALFLCFVAFPDGEPGSTSPGNALVYAVPITVSIYRRPLSHPIKIQGFFC